MHWVSPYCHHQLLEVLLLRSVHDDEEVDQPPNATAATSEQLTDTKTDVTDDEAVDTQFSEQYRQNNGKNGVRVVHCHNSHFVV